MKIGGFAPVTPLLFRACVTFAANVIFGRILNRRVPRGPLFVTWLLTFDCNAFCGFCGTHTLKKKYPETMSLDRALAIADEIARSGTWMVGFTGGEVFLSPLLFPLIERLKSHGLMVYIVTNGSDLKEQAQRLVDLRVDFVVVSLDFDDPQEHNDNRKFAGLFESAVSGIEELKRLRRNGRPGIRTNTVLMKENLARAGEILDYLDGIVDDVHVQPISYGLENNPHNRGRERIYKYVFDESERAETERHLEEQVLSRKSFANNYFRKIKDYWFEPEKLAQKTPCWAPFLRMLIQPTGEVLHCAANSEFGVVGNLTDQALMEVWNGDQLRGDREIIGRKKNNCICWSRDTSFNSFMDDLPLANRLPYLGKKRLDPGL